MCIYAGVVAAYQRPVPYSLQLCLLIPPQSRLVQGLQSSRTTPAVAVALSKNSISVYCVSHTSLWLTTLLATRNYLEKQFLPYQQFPRLGGCVSLRYQREMVVSYLMISEMVFSWFDFLPQLRRKTCWKGPDALQATICHSILGAIFSDRIHPRIASLYEGHYQTVMAFNFSGEDPLRATRSATCCRYSVMVFSRGPL